MVFVTAVGPGAIVCMYGIHPFLSLVVASQFRGGSAVVMTVVVIFVMFLLR